MRIIEIPPNCSNSHSNNVQNNDDYLLGVTLIDEKEYQVNRDFCIGRGQQSVVYEGTFGEVKVAVKTIRLSNTVPKDAIKEISVLKSINHKNCIFLHGVCIEKKKISLLLEYVKGITLAELIDEEDHRLHYEFCRHKPKIAIQLTTAVKVLQDNILVNEHSDIKICDFGLGKFTLTQTNLRTTTGRTMVGSRAYSAPEIILLNEPATVWSDIWSIGVIIFEVFKEDSAWPDISDPQQLEDLLRKKSKPYSLTIEDVRFIDIKDVIESCFSHLKEERPSAIELHNRVKNALEK